MDIVEIVESQTEDRKAFGENISSTRGYTANHRGFSSSTERMGFEYQYFTKHGFGKVLPPKKDINQKMFEIYWN